MQRHPVIGERILSKVEDYADIARVVRHHHERVDGLGYPDSLKAEEICLSIPRREALLIFAKEDRAYRDRMRAMIEEMEGNQPKPLTLGLFTLRTDVPVPLLE